MPGDRRGFPDVAPRGREAADGMQGGSTPDVWVLGLCALALGLSFIPTVTPDDRSIEFLGRRAPEICGAKVFSRAGCPGCGMTRAFVLLSHGEPGRAFRLNFAAPLLYALLWLQIPYRLHRLRRPPREEPRPMAWAWSAMLVAIVGGWIARIVAGP